MLREALYWFGGRRRGSLARLTRLAAHPDPGLREGLVRAVARWSTPGVAELLDGLAEDPHPDVREAVEAPLCFPRSCKRAAGLRVRHDCCPLSNG